MVLAPGPASPTLRPSPRRTPWSRARPAARGPDEQPGGVVLAVAGAVGGAGASSLAVACAVAAHGGAVLVDLTAGGGLDVLLGLEAAAGARWPDLVAARGDVDPELLTSSLPHKRGVGVLSADRRRPGPPDDAVVADVLRALAARHRTVVVDVGRRAVPAAATHVALVVPLTVPGLAGALAWRASGAGLPELVVTCGPAPGRLTPDDVASALGVPVTAHVGRVRGARAAVERGDGPPVGHGTPLRRAAVRVLEAAVLDAAALDAGAFGEAAAVGGGAAAPRARVAWPPVGVER
ncbi:pilus assembly protein FlpE [Luteimicrobium sp. NPDC057192]|uniref:pilus assembly protein FlpE n=1 Tax=Luteimicrobium sp. NPDC057192 TaxID=3346042 RepID=UPI0036439A9D